MLGLSKKSTVAYTYKAIVQDVLPLHILYHW